jgi:hypothetical protein
MAGMMSNQDATRVPQYKIEIYRLLLEEVNNALMQAQEHTRIGFLNSVDDAVAKLSHSENVLAKDVKEVADYLVRDCLATAEHLQSTGKSLAEWFEEDATLAESYLARWLPLIADKTTFEWASLQQQAALHKQRQYRVGELVMLADLRCVDCDTITHIGHIQEITPCSVCEGTLFKRVK